MAHRLKYENFTDLPQPVQDFFMDKVDACYDEIIKQYSLNEQNFFGQVEDPVLNCALGFADIATIPDKLRLNLADYSLSDEALHGIWLMLLRGVFWPLRDFLGRELTDYLKQNNISTADWPTTRVVYQPLSYTGASSEVINRLGLHSLGPKLRQNLRAGIERFHKGELVPSGLKDLLVHVPEMGGLGLDDKTATAAVEVVENIAKSVPLMSEAEYEERLNELARAVNLPKAGDDDEDAKEISTIRAAMPAAPPRPQTELEKAVSEAYVRITEKPTDDYLARRLENLISTRLRDVRNQAEVTALLQRDIKVGGMGLDRGQSQAMAAEIESAYKDFHANIEAEEKHRIEEQITEQKRKIEERKQEEAAAHARWYQEKVKAKEETENVKAKLQAVVASAPVMQKSAVLEEKRFGPMIAVSPPATTTTKDYDSPLSSSSAASPSSSSSGVAKAETRGSTPSDVRGQVKISAASAIIAAKTPATVDGIKPVGAPRLQGLMGEVGNMTLAGFRRLADNPEAAAGKIIERLNTLGEESLDKRVSGIREWQQSPVMKLYLSLVAESFKTGQPLAKVAEAERASGIDTLTSQEIEVLVNLNNKLHF